MSAPGSWSNPVNFTVDLTDGDTVTLPVYDFHKVMEDFAAVGNISATGTVEAYLEFSLDGINWSQAGGEFQWTEDESTVPIAIVVPGSVARYMQIIASSGVEPSFTGSVSIQVIGNEGTNPWDEPQNSMTGFSWSSGAVQSGEIVDLGRPVTNIGVAWTCINADDLLVVLTLQGSLDKEIWYPIPSVTVTNNAGINQFATSTTVPARYVQAQAQITEGSGTVTSLTAVITAQDGLN